MLPLAAALLLACSAAQAVHPLRWTGTYHCDEGRSFRITAEVEGRHLYLRWQGKPYVLDDRGSSDSTFDWQGSGFRWQGTTAENALSGERGPLASHCARGTATSAPGADGRR
jgi:hypothetical protein